MKVLGRLATELVSLTSTKPVSHADSTTKSVPSRLSPDSLSAFTRPSPVCCFMPMFAPLSATPDFNIGFVMFSSLMKYPCVVICRIFGDFTASMFSSLAFSLIPNFSKLLDDEPNEIKDEMKSKIAGRNSMGMEI